MSCACVPWQAVEEAYVPVIKLEFEGIEVRCWLTVCAALAYHAPYTPVLCLCVFLYQLENMKPDQVGGEISPYSSFVHRTLWTECLCVMSPD